MWHPALAWLERQVTEVMKITLAGDVNLMGVGDPEVPFAELAGVFHAADLCYANLECCLFDATPETAADGYFVSVGVGSAALKASGIGAVGIANNVNYGREAILSSLQALSGLGLPFTGAGRNVGEARSPMIVERNGVRVGILQRTAIYWPQQHEATEEAPGVAVVAAHTSYRSPSPTRRRPGLPPANRPGMPAEIETWPEPHSLDLLSAELRVLRPQVDVLIASFHWGLFDEVLGYMHDYARAAIDCGVDLVMGHGPHDHLLPIEMWNGRPIFYNLGALCFQQGPGGKRFHDWVGLLVQFDVDRERRNVTFEFVRQDPDLRIRRVPPALEPQALETLRRKSAPLGARLTIMDDKVLVTANK
jgi:poly-gamma-glutamate capsule biosynthesis protein CapA/YwtB (metallophosphatase superfamily)